MMIRLTRTTTGGSVYVAPAHIVKITSHANGAFVGLSTGVAIDVVEDAEEIVRRIRAFSMPLNFPPESG